MLDNRAVKRQGYVQSEKLIMSIMELDSDNNNNNACKLGYVRYSNLCVSTFVHFCVAR